MKAWSSQFGSWLLTWSLKFQQTRPYPILRKTFAVIFPFILIGSWARALNLSVFSRDGFFAVIYGLQTAIPQFEQIHNLLTMIQSLTLGMIGLAASYFVARYTARSYHKDGTLAALTAFLSNLILNDIGRLGQVGNNFFDNLGYRGLIPGIVLGFIVGWLFRFTNVDRSRTAREATIAELIMHSLKGLWLIGLILLASLLIRAGMTSLKTASLSGLVNYLVRLPAGNTEHVSLRIGMITFLNGLLWWLGFQGPIDPLTPITNGTSATANLNYALAHGNLFKVPSPVTMGTIFRPFASFGGIGMTLALVIAILIVGHVKPQRQIAGLALGPSLVNIGTPIMIGFPVMLNPIMLIPYLLAPAVNTFIAWLAIRSHFMPPSVYTIPPTTPGPLAAFLATNGNWVALAISMLCLTLSVMIYIPFIRLAERAINPDDFKEAAHEKSLA